MDTLLDGLSVHDLRSVVVLSEVLHFGRAAEICGMAQPSLSASLKKVEQAVGAKLFLRSSRRCELTDSGIEFVGAARVSLEALDGIVSRGSESRARFRLGMIPTIGPYFVQDVLPTMLSVRREWEISIVEAMTAELESMVLGRQLDAAVVSLPISNVSFRLQTLYHERLVLAVDSGHSWAACGAVKVSDLQPERLLVLEQGHCLRAQTLEACGSSQVSEKPGHALGLATLMGMVSAGAGYTVLPETARSWAISGRGVTLVPFEAPEPTRTIALMTLDSRAHELRGFSEALGEVSFATGGTGANTLDG